MPQISVEEMLFLQHGQGVNEFGFVATAAGY